MSINANELLDYACIKFQAESYEEALEAFVLTYSYGYQQAWILDTIYNCYMEGNDLEFRKAFAQRNSELDLTYENCVLDFIPYKDGEYYIFDKEMEVFRGLFSIHELKNTEPDEILRKLEFSAIGLEFDWNWNKEKHILTSALEQKIYAVCHDMNRAVSFWKIPELGEYLGNVKFFHTRNELQDFFHENTSEYLPQLIYGCPKDKEELLKIVKQEHQYRLTPEGRNTENILLTIGIPTHDRGHLLLKRLETLQQLPYDAEIEFAISKNGTHYYQEEYHSVETISDARIQYVGYNEELTMSVNWHNVVNMARGKFVLMLSDEDDIIPGALEHYLKFLTDHEALGMVRARTCFQYSSFDKNEYYKKGKEAFEGGFLMQNYLSGAIYNRQLFQESNIPFWNEWYKENTFYKPYPHMWWQVLLAFKGDYAVDNTYLVQEGDSVLLEESMRYRADAVENSGLAEGGTDKEYPNITTVSTYEARLSQFQGCIALIKHFPEFDEELRTIALYLLVGKMLYLMEMVAKGYHYKEDEFPQWVIRLTDEAMLSVEELSISTERKRFFLQALKVLVHDIENSMKNT